MFIRRMTAASLILALAGCGTMTASTATIDRSQIPLSGGGTPVLSPEGAIGFAAYTLGNPSAARGHPRNGALALAAVDYLAGDFYVDPRFQQIPALDKVRMLQGRTEVRQALAIAPDATSQQVVDGLVAAYEAYPADDPNLVAKALPIGVFTLGPAGTTNVLANLPNLVSANAAAQNANAYINSGCTQGTGGGGCF